MAYASCACTDICGESGCCLEKDHKGVCSFVAIEEHDYEVEAIVAQRRTRKGTEYLVKWLNWPTEDNTWEFEANLAGAGEVLAAWKRSHLNPCARNASTACTDICGESGCCLEKVFLTCQMSVRSAERGGRSPTPAGARTRANIQFEPQLATS